MSFCYLRKNRLKEDKSFKKIKSAKNRLYGKYIGINYVFTDDEFSKLGIIATRKFGKAHARNYFKRSIRESFRLSKHLIKKNIYIIAIQNS